MATGLPESFFATLKRAVHSLSKGIWGAWGLNFKMLMAKAAGKKTIAIQCADTQFMHLKPVVEELARSAKFKQLSVYFLTNPASIAALHEQTKAVVPSAVLGSHFAARFLLFCDCYLAVEQGTSFPYFGCKIRACSFHGQPSKGNVYSRFKHKQINALFFYGPLMRDYYLKTRKLNPHWPKITWYEVGQPLSDKLFTGRLTKQDARGRLGLDHSLLTLIYAPSFEYCSSIGTDGMNIIDSLLELGINVIVKPHPAFYNAAAFEDDFNHAIPSAHAWGEYIHKLHAHPRCFFPPENSLESIVALSASDIMLTDCSGVGFDGISLDLGMIYWDCPAFFFEYLPRRFGIDGEDALRDLACNAGREAGIVVHNLEELASAVSVYRNDLGHKAELRKSVREKLLFNPGCAAKVMARELERLLGV
jgi:hypothetical protein